MMERSAEWIRLMVPLLYGACFVLLLWQAFRVMAQGFRAVPPMANGRTDGTSSDRTGRVTIHPELLDANGQLTQEDLLTVRFGGEAEPPRVSGEPTE
jgi:hypothetical protein